MAILSSIAYKAASIRKGTKKLYPNVEKVPDLETLETELTRQLAVVQSSSLSYLLLASAEQAVAWADDAGEDFSEYYRRVQRFRKELRDDLSSASAGIILEEFPRIQDPTRIFLRFISSKEGGPGQAVSVARIADHLENDDGIVVEFAGCKAFFSSCERGGFSIY